MDEDEKQYVKKLKREITIMQEALHNKNLELDAMHYVWCDGGCYGGIHRWSHTPGEISEELVSRAEANVKRLRTWYKNFEGRKLWNSLNTDEERAALFDEWFPNSKNNPYRK